MIGGVPVSRLLPGAGLDDLIIVASTEMNTDEDRAAYRRQALAALPAESAEAETHVHA